MTDRPDNLARAIEWAKQPIWEELDSHVLATLAAEALREVKVSRRYTDNVVMNAPLNKARNDLDARLAKLFSDEPEPYE